MIIYECIADGRADVTNKKRIFSFNDDLIGVVQGIAPNEFSTSNIEFVTPN